MLCSRSLTIGYGINMRQTIQLFDMYHRSGKLFQSRMEDLQHVINIFVFHHWCTLEPKTLEFIQHQPSDKWETDKYDISASYTEWRTLVLFPNVKSISYETTNECVTAFRYRTSARLLIWPYTHSDSSNCQAGHRQLVKTKKMMQTNDCNFVSVVANS